MATTKEVADALAVETVEREDALALHAAHREELTDLTTRLLLSRFDTQDKVLEGILHEAKRTNGRIRVLESKRDAAEVRAEVVDEGVIQHHEALVARRDRLRFYMTCVTIVTSGGVGALVDHFVR